MLQVLLDAAELLDGLADMATIGNVDGHMPADTGHRTCVAFRSSDGVEAIAAHRTGKSLEIHLAHALADGKVLQEHEGGFADQNGICLRRGLQS